MTDAPLSLRSILASSYCGQRALVTGHNGFVGSWLASLLVAAGCETFGFALPPSEGGAWERAGLADRVDSVEGDVRDLTALRRTVARVRPDFVFHLAAQALVLPALIDPVQTFATNVLGTANLLEVLRDSSIRSCVIVTSDKCYATGASAHTEADPLGGDDPYSASKGCAELVVGAFRSSYFSGSNRQVASARAGNIIGGGDRADARIVPDFVRAAEAGRALVLRFPRAVRPWQHVLDAVAGYLRLGVALLDAAPSYAEAWNFGPDESMAATVGDLVSLLGDSWKRRTGRRVEVTEAAVDNADRERGYLTLDSRKATERLGWHPVLDLPQSADWTVEWHLAEAAGAAASAHFDQIRTYLALEEQNPAVRASVAAGGA